MEVPDWNRGDRIKSILEVAGIGRAALAGCINDAADWIETKLKGDTDDTTSK